MRRWKPFVCWVCLALTLLLVAVVANIEIQQAYNYHGRRSMPPTPRRLAVCGRW